MFIKKVIFVFVFLFLFAVLFQTYTFLQITASPKITGQISNTATVSFCYNNPPELEAIPDQSARATQLFTYLVEVTDLNANADFIYYDNTSLFNITQTGLISFTPSSSDIGTYNIEITVDDNSSCSNSNDTKTFSLTISEYVPPEALPPVAAPSVVGAGLPPPKLSFQLSQELLKVTLSQSQKLEKKIMITNNGTVDLKIEIENPLSDLVYLTPPTFDLPVAQTKEILLVFNYQKEAPFGVHSGQLVIKGTHGSYITKLLTLILEVESEELFFDASLDLLKKTLFPDEELQATITLFNLKKIIPIANVTLTYLISDLKQGIIYEEKETLTVEDQVSFSKTIPLPSGIQPGQYLFSLNVQYADSFATASEVFTIEAPPSPLVGMAASWVKEPTFFLSIPLMFFVVIVILVILFIMLHFIRRKIKKPKIILESDIARLKRKLSLLKESYQKGYIKEETYKKTQADLEKLIQKKSLGK